MRQRRRLQFNVPRRPYDARNGQRPLGEELADRRAPGRALQGAVEPKQRRDLTEPPLRLEIAVFVEQGLLGMIELPERGPIDLATEERLRVKVAAPGERRPLQLADRHSVLVQDAQLELVDDRAFRRAGFVHREAKKAAGRRSPPEAVAIAVAGFDAADLAKCVSVVGEMHREDGSIILSPFDERPEGRSNMTEIDRYAFAGRDFDRRMAERRDSTRLQDRGGVGGTVKVDLDNLPSALRFRSLRSSSA